MVEKICGKGEFEPGMEQRMCDGGWEWWAGWRWECESVGLLVVIIWLQLCTSISSSCHHHLHHP